ncbi:MAG: CBS domain-containing protein [Myxococcota bacterium]
MSERPIASFMTQKVVVVEPDCPLMDVLSKLRAYRISCVIVCEENVPIGIISERDVVGVAYNLAAEGAESRQTAWELMSSTVTTVQATDTLEDAIRLTQRERVRHLPVVDVSRRLVGLVTQTDLLRTLTRPNE